MVFKIIKLIRLFPSLIKTRILNKDNNDIVNYGIKLTEKLPVENLKSSWNSYVEKLRGSLKPIKSKIKRML